MLLIYPLFGRILSEVTDLLIKAYLRVYNLETQHTDIYIWRNDFNKFEFGSIWPLTIIVTLYLVIAVIAGGVYRLVWPKD